MGSTAELTSPRHLLCCVYAALTKVRVCACCHPHCLQALAGQRPDVWCRLPGVLLDAALEHFNQADSIEAAATAAQLAKVAAVHSKVVALQQQQVKAVIEGDAIMQALHRVQQEQQWRLELQQVVADVKAAMAAQQVQHEQQQELLLKELAELKAVVQAVQQQQQRRDAS